jgi:hypothetical protein
MDYLGYITQAPEGVRRYDYTPSLPLNMLLIKDTINTTTTQYSSLHGGTWQDIYGTSIADLYAKNNTAPVDYADGVAADNRPPPGGYGSGRGPLAQ